MSTCFPKKMMKKYFIFILVVLLSLLNAKAEGASASFSVTDAQETSTPDMPLKGMQMWYAPLLGSNDKKARHIKRLRAELDSLKAIGGNTIGVLAGVDFVPSPTDSAHLTNGTLVGRCTENRILKGLDCVLAELSKRQMKAIVTLVRQWDDASLTDQAMEDFVQSLAQRVNPATKQRLLSDPTIRFWQVSDAPLVKDKATSASYMDWAAKQAKMMKRIGFTQPVSIAYKPFSSQTEANEQVIEDILSRECFDAFALSLDPLSMGWLTAGELNNGLGRIYVRYTDILQMVMRMAQAYDKPFFLADCAYPRTAMFTRPGTNTESRDNFFSFLQSAYSDMTEGQRTPFLGIVFKGWGGNVRPSTDLWTNPYDFTAEYPDETKGRYSIFTNDSTTIQLLRGAWAR